MYQAKTLTRFVSGGSREWNLQADKNPVLSRRGNKTCAEPGGSVAVLGHLLDSPSFFYEKHSPIFFKLITNLDSCIRGLEFLVILREKKKTARTV